MLSLSQEVHRLKYISCKWRFFKDLFTKVTKCWYVKDIELDEVNNVGTFKKVYKIGGIKLESKVLMEAIWEEEVLENDKMKITVYVQESKPNKEAEV